MSSGKRRLSNGPTGTESENIGGSGPSKRPQLARWDESSPIDQRDFEVAIICALPLEASVISALFDKRYDGKIYSNAPGDSNAYSLGVIGRHNVVLVHMPRMGKVAAATAATGLRASFQGIQLALVVGICGGAPLRDRQGKDILLGDVVISKGLVQYDFGRKFPNNMFLPKDAAWDSLPRPSPKICAVLAKLETKQEQSLLQTRTSKYLEELHLELKEMEPYPGMTEDKLFESTYRHKHHGSSGCKICSNDNGVICYDAIKLGCKELGCEERKLVPRTRLSRPYSPVIHLGLIGSGDTVMKSGEDRDYISTKNDIIAFEMEGAGVWETFPSIVIKGVCDYADSHKNKRWQGYAAATAAAVTKSFLENWSPDTISHPPRHESQELKDEGQLEKLPYVPEAVFDSKYREGKAFCQPRTRTKLLQEIYEWRGKTDNECIFWLNGMAGTGKSTIASTVAKDCADKKHLAGSFFFSRGEGDLSSAKKVLTTLAQQLVRSIPGYKSAVLKTLSENGDVSEKNLAEQWRLLIQEPLSQLKGFSSNFYSPIYVIVIDALDECDSKTDVEMIIQLFAKAKAIKSVIIKLFVTSRPELEILYKFQSLTPNSRRELILHNVETAVISSDIAIFLEKELGEIGRQFKFPSGWPGSDDIQRLVEQAAGLFIYAATICRFIKDAKLRAKSRLNSLLVVSPSPNPRPSSTYATRKLDELYTEVLVTAYTGDYDDIDQEEIARDFQQVVGAIVILFDSLDSNSLALLVGSEPDVTDLVIDNLGSVLGKYQTGTIRLLHPSFRDFLLSNTRCTDRRFQVDEGQAHEKMTSCCLDLLDTNLRQNLCGLPFAGTPISEIQVDKINNCLPPHVQYACRYWVRHLCQSNKEMEIDGPVHKFLQSHVLHWLEALSLMGILPEGIIIIETLLSRLERSENALYSLVYSVKRFVLFHRSVIEHRPLQIYWSCLLFSPKQCPIRKQPWGEISSGIESAPMIREDWDPCLQVLGSKSISVSSVTFSRDGKQLASSSHGNGTITLWDSVTGVQLAILNDFSRDIASIAFSCDGKIASGSFDDEIVNLWDTATGTYLTKFKGHSGPVLSVVFSYDGKHLAFSSNESIMLCDPTTGVHFITLNGHLDFVRSIAFSYDNKRLASNSNETIKLWDTTTWVCLITIENNLAYNINFVTFSHDDKQLASSSGRDVVLWDTSTGACLTFLMGKVDSFVAKAVTFLSEGKLATGVGDGTITIWDTVTKAHLNTIEGHRNTVTSLAFSHGKLASSSDDGTIRLWDTATIALYADSERHGHSGPVEAVVFSPDGKRLASTSSYDGEIKIWDTATGACITTFKVQSNSYSVIAFSSDGKQLASSTSIDKEIMLWDIITGTPLAILEGHSGSILSIALSDKLLASSSSDETIKLWDMTTRTCISTFEGYFHARNIVNLVKFSRDGKILASSSYGGNIMLWDVATGARLSVLRNPSNWAPVLTFSPDGGQLISAGFFDGSLTLWDTKTGICLATVEGHQKPILCIAFLRDNMIVSGSSDGTIKLWDTTALAETSGSTPTSLTGPAANTPPSYTQGGRTPKSRDVLSVPSAFELFSMCLRDDAIAFGFETGQVLMWSFEDSPHLTPWYLR